MNSMTGQGHKKILLVDDQLLTRISIARLLQHYLFDIISVGCGESAMAHLNGYAGASFFDLCIFDIDLPDVNGLLLLKIVKEVSPSTPVIIMTGDSVDQETQAIIETATSSLITKPFEVSCFMDKVLGTLQAPPAPPPVLVPSPPPSGRDERKTARAALRRPLDFTFSHVVPSEETVGGRRVQLDLQGDTTDISEAGLGFRTAYPLQKNQVVIFPAGSVGRTGVIKWSRQMPDDTHHVGLKFI